MVHRLRRCRGDLCSGWTEVRSLPCIRRLSCGSVRTRRLVRRYQKHTLFGGQGGPGWSGKWLRMVETDVQGLLILRQVTCEKIWCTKRSNRNFSKIWFFFEVRTMDPCRRKFLLENPRRILDFGKISWKIWEFWSGKIWEFWSRFWVGPQKTFFF